MQAITVGLDIAKSVFQVHGVDADGQVVIRRQLKRRYVLRFSGKLAHCLFGVEAVAAPDHRSRQLRALGHTVRLMTPSYVKPYVKRQKNDATDAEAICEAVGRANMRFGPTKTPEQQSHAALVYSTADLGDQCNQSPLRSVWHRCAGRSPRGRGAASWHRQRKAGSRACPCLPVSAWRSAAQDQRADSGVRS